MSLNQRHRVILVHDFAESDRRGMLDDDSRYLLSFSEFRRALDQSIENGLLFDSIGSDDSPERGRVEITSDDGGGSALLLADHLKGLGIRARFFIVTGWIGTNGFLTRDEIRYIHSLGHLVGSHGHTHPNPFCDLDRRHLRQEVFQSREILEDLLGCAVDLFSVPGGEVLPRTIRELQERDLGLFRIYTSTPHQGVYIANTTSSVLGRYCLVRSMDYRKIASVLEGRGWIYNRLRYRAGRLKRELAKGILSWTSPRPRGADGQSV